MQTIDGLEDDPWPNLDVRPLVGFAPLLRIRIGVFRILLRPLTDGELHTLGVDLPDTGYYILRVIDKQYVQQVLRGMPKTQSPALKPPVE